MIFWVAAAERNQAQEELKRFKEERIVSDLSTSETERHLRTQLAALQKSIADNQDSNNGDQDGTHAMQQCSTTTTPPSSPIKTSSSSPHPNVDARKQHTHVSGSAKYTLHVLDYDGVVRGLNSLRLPKDESTRENITSRKKQIG